MQNGKRSLPKGRLLPGGPGRGGGGGSASSLCSLRWAMPVLLTAAVSYYIVYLILYSGRPSQQAADSHAWGQRRGSKKQHASDKTSGGVPGSLQAAAAGSHRYAPQDAAFQWVTAAGRRMRVAVVNDAPYHLEIVAGLLQVLGGMPVDVTWYQAEQKTPDGTLSPTELVEVTGFTQLLGYLPQMRPRSETPSPCDYAILVSPEYFIQKTKVGGARVCEWSSGRLQLGHPPCWPAAHKWRACLHVRLPRDVTHACLCCCCRLMRRRSWTLPSL